MGGKLDPIVITIPKGSYIPTFAFGPSTNEATSVPSGTGMDDQVREASRPTLGTPKKLLIGGAAIVVILAVVWVAMTILAPSVATAPEIPRILVTKLDDLAMVGPSASIANGLTQEIVGQLSKFREILVIQGADEMVVAPEARFLLSGSVDVSSDAFHLRVTFINREDGTVLWANSFDGVLKPSELLQAQTKIAGDVAATVAQSYGLVSQADAKRSVVNAPDDWAAYSCVLSYYSYRATLERNALPQVRQCLERAVDRFPNYATAWALLAQSYLEDIRFRFPRDPVSAPVEVNRALETARHAVRLDPFNVRAMQAEMFALFFNGEFEAGKKVGERALALNPNDTELLGEYGYRLALSGEWQPGCALIAQARERNPSISGYYESGLALCSYFTGNLEEAAMWIKKTTIPTNALYHLIAAAIFGEMGSLDEGEKELAWICLHQPDLLKAVRQELAARLGREKDVEFFLSSLSKAGLGNGDENGSCH